MAYHQRLLQAQRFDETPHELCLFGQPARRAARLNRIARSRTIERDQPVARAEMREQRVAEVVELSAKPVQEDNRLSIADIDIVNAVAVDLDEFSDRRHQPFGLGRDPQCRQHKAADGEDRQQQQNGQQPRQYRQEHRSPGSDEVSLAASGRAATSRRSGQDIAGYHRSAGIADSRAPRYFRRPVLPEPSMPEIVTAAMLVIGDEILSGRTKDKNIGHLADIMTAIGIDLKEVRIVPDEEDEIVAAVNAVRARYTYVFTTGGIGPTHDDITADSIAKAFGVPCEYDAKAYALLEASYAERGIEYTEARKRMSRMPRGADHIDNPVSVAPGFRIGNVHVMAGVPSIFQAMLDNVVPTLRAGTKMLSATVHCPFGEGLVGGPLGDIQKAHPDTIIGSYPKYGDGKFWTELVVRARSQEALDAARADVEAMVAGFAAKAG